MPDVRRSELEAYLIGAAVAGTALVFPYTGRSVLGTLFPQIVVASVPFFLLPIAWGVWNWLYVRNHVALDPGTWGALLGVLGGLAVNAILWFEGQWFWAALLLPGYVPAVYYVVWHFVIGPLNHVLAAER